MPQCWPSRLPQGPIHPELQRNNFSYATCAYPSAVTGVGVMKPYFTFLHPSSQHPASIHQPCMQPASHASQSCNQPAASPGTGQGERPFCAAVAGRERKPPSVAEGGVALRRDSKWLCVLLLNGKPIANRREINEKPQKKPGAIRGGATICEASVEGPSAVQELIELALSLSLSLRMRAQAGKREGTSRLRGPVRELGSSHVRKPPR